MMISHIPTFTLVGVSIGAIPLMLSAALFIRPENLSLQQLTISLHGRLSLGAEPSCSRPPWVKLNRFPPSLPQSGALSIARGAVVVGAIKKPLTATPRSGSPFRGEAYEQEV